jgi:hypothetical protein
LEFPATPAGQPFAGDQNCPEKSRRLYRGPKPLLAGAHCGTVIAEPVRLQEWPDAAPCIGGCKLSTDAAGVPSSTPGHRATGP